MIAPPVFGSRCSGGVGGDTDQLPLNQTLLSTFQPFHRLMRGYGDGDGEGSTTTRSNYSSL